MHHNDDARVDRVSLEAPVSWNIDYPSWAADEILPRLFMGGTHDDATVAEPAELAGLAAEGETVIEGAEAAAVSHPDFWTDLARLAGPGVVATEEVSA